MFQMLKVFGVCLCMLMASTGFAAEIDSRFHIHVASEKDVVLTVADAMKLALPTLWKRVVPIESMPQANRLSGRTSLVLQFKAVKHGVDLVFNPVQVKSYLQGYGV
ncbi:MAG: hypothetical protein R8M14_09800, partial [Ghiorsea sp.]